MAEFSGSRRQMTLAWISTSGGKITFWFVFSDVIIFQFHSLIAIMCYGLSIMPFGGVSGHLISPPCTSPPCCFFLRFCLCTATESEHQSGHKPSQMKPQNDLSTKNQVVHLTLLLIFFASYKHWLVEFEIHQILKICIFHIMNGHKSSQVTPIIDYLNNKLSRSVLSYSCFFHL